jgi:hypothetical protein
MDASHLILDWSWYFDNHAMYNGRQHLYSVKTAKKKVHILPMQKDFLSSRKTLLCVLTEEFELELEEEGMCLIVASTTFALPEKRKAPSTS